jgi:hypothetical protein
MGNNIFAYTAMDPSYPGYVSINRKNNGDVSVSVRAAPETRQGVYVCGFARDAGSPGRCTPGSPNCNNYCNMHPDKSLPMADHPLPCEHVVEGVTAQFTIPADQWRLS